MGIIRVTSQVTYPSPAGGPLSEHIGRRNLTIATFVLFNVWTLGCALSPNWPAFLIFRFLCGAFGSAPIAVVTGQLADIYEDPVSRGVALSYFMVVGTALSCRISCLLTILSQDDLGWTSISPHHCRVLLYHHWLALGILDRSYICWCDTDSRSFYAA
jgi:MFS family permease